jgi:hypothetical protein
VLFQDSQNLASQGSPDMYTLHEVNTKVTLTLYSKVGRCSSSFISIFDSLFCLQQSHSRFSVFISNSCELILISSLLHSIKFLQTSCSW